MYTEALTTYQSIAKNKFLVHGPKVKINMGNIYFKQGNPTKAIKMYRMAMDQLTNTNKDLRYAHQKNKTEHVSILILNLFHH
jgi:intraflagellar transport protein 88